MTCASCWQPHKDHTIHHRRLSFPTMMNDRPVRSSITIRIEDVHVRLYRMEHDFDDCNKWRNPLKISIYRLLIDFLCLLMSSLKSLLSHYEWWYKYFIGKWYESNWKTIFNGVIGLSIIFFFKLLKKFLLLFPKICIKILGNLCQYSGEKKNQHFFKNHYFYFVHLEKVTLQFEEIKRHFISFIFALLQIFCRFRYR